MEHTSHTLATAFLGQRLLATGPLAQVALSAKAAGDSAEPLLVFDDGTGAVIDLDLRGTDDEVIRRLGPGVEEPRGPGRPRLGVVAREVTLLPRHWDWLNRQKGGASVALRKLVEEARRAMPDQERQRQSQEAAYRVMSALAGDLPGFEEASRALFAGEPARFSQVIAAWPKDLVQYVQRLWAPEVQAVS